MATSVDCRLLGWAEDGPRLDLDHARFAYAGNFGTGRKGIAVALAGDEDGSGSSGVGVDDGSDADDGGNADGAGEEVSESGSEDVAEVDGRPVLAAASFDEDRAVPDALRIRYVTVREDHRGEGIGPELLAFVVERASARGYERVRIGVNNPIAYRACYRAGFGFADEESGMGELVLEAPSADRSVERYRDGLERFADRDLPERQRRVLERHRDGEPPEDRPG